MRQILSVAFVLGCATGSAVPSKVPASRAAPDAPVPAAVAPALLQPASGPARLPYPPTRRDGVSEALHGVTVPDPYRWLEDEKSPEVQAWMREQDAFARSQLRSWPGRADVVRRLSELLYVDVLGAPRHRGNRWFYTRQFATKEK